jgi:hypothetical protein
MENEASLSIEDLAPTQLTQSPCPGPRGTIFGTTEELTPEELTKRVEEHAKQMTPRT